MHGKRRNIYISYIYIYYIHIYIYRFIDIFKILFSQTKM